MGDQGENMFRKCTSCGGMKPLDDFRSDVRYKGGKKTSCKECERGYQREYWKSYKKGKLKKPLRKPKPLSADKLIEEYINFSKKHGYEYGAPAGALINQNEISDYNTYLVRFGGLKKLRKIAYKERFQDEIENAQIRDWRQCLKELNKLIGMSSLTKKEIMEKTGMALSHVYQFLSAKSSPQLKTFLRVANAIGINVEIKADDENSTENNNIREGFDDWVYYILKLKQLSKDSGLTYLDISERTGIKQVGQFFTGLSIPRLDKFFKIVNAVGAHIEFNMNND